MRKMLFYTKILVVFGMETLLGTTQRGQTPRAIPSTGSGRTLGDRPPCVVPYFRHSDGVCPVRVVKA